MEVIYADSQPGTLVYAFPENGNLADWNTAARVQLIESASPNTGRWIGDLSPGRWRIFEGSSQPTAFSESVYVYSIPSDSGVGPRTVVIGVELDGEPLQNATVRMELGADYRQGTTGVGGTVQFNVINGLWKIAIVASGCRFDGATLNVTASTSITYDVERTSLAPISINGGSTGRFRCISRSRVPMTGVSVSVQISQGSGEPGFVHEGKPIASVSDVDGYCYFPDLTRGATYKICFQNFEREFTVPDEDDFLIPEIIAV